MSWLRKLGGIVAIAVVAIWSASGCSHSVYRPAQDAAFQLDPVQEINDEDVRKAFAAQPQLPAQIKVAYYVFDDEFVEPIEKMLRGQQSVVSTYRIPTLLVTGERRFDEPGWGPKPSTPPLSIKKLRLMAARARADVLLIFDYGHRYTYSPNGLVVFCLALVPALFLPIQDVSAQSYLDTYVIDTRNGYLYGQVTAEREAEEDYLLIYSGKGRELVDAQQSELVAEAGRLLAKLLAKHVGTGPGVAPAPQRYEGWPGSSAGEASLCIAFGAGGELYVDGVQVASDEQAKLRIAERLRSGPLSATLQAHAGVPHRRVVEILDLLRALKVTSVGIVPSPPAPRPGSDPPLPREPQPPEEPDRPALPNPASGEPSRVTPPPSFPPHGTPQPLTPAPVPR